MSTVFFDLPPHVTQIYIGPFPVYKWQDMSSTYNTQSFACHEPGAVNTPDGEPR